MKRGDPVPSAEQLARSVILPTHLPQNRLSDEHLLNFQSEKAEDIAKDWGATYVLSVTCRSLASDEKVHEEGVKLASEQNEKRPLEEKDASTDFGHKRHYMGFYSFTPTCLAENLQSSEAFEVLFWPEGEFKAHANACMRFSKDVEKRKRSVRRTALIGLLWRKLNGPTRFVHNDTNPHHDFLNKIVLEDLPAA